MEAMLTGMFTILSAYINKLDKSHTSNLKVHLNALDKKKQD